MRISFRTKLFLSLTLTVGTILGVTLAVQERSFAGRVDDLIRSEIDRGHRNFHKHAEHIRDDLVAAAAGLASVQRLVGAFESRDLHAETIEIVLNELEIQRQINAQFAAVATHRGEIVAQRLLWTAGAARDSAARLPFERRPPDPKGGDPETPFVRRLLPLWKQAKEAADAGGPPLRRETIVADGFMVVEERLFQVVACPIVEGEDRLRGVLLLGTEVTGQRADLIHDLQNPEHGAGFVVGDRLIAASLAGARRTDAGELIARHLRSGVHTDHRMTMEAALGGVPFRIVLDAMGEPGHAPPIYTGLFISLEELTSFRRNMRTVILVAAVAALLLALAVSHLVSRGISRPVHDLVDGTRMIARGDYSHRVAVRSRDEIGDLAGAFNRMAEDLATKEKIRGVLNKVVAKDVADELLKGDLGLGGRLVRATLLFADLRGFTALTRGKDPQWVVAMLNDYMTAMSREIFACRGIVDKYVGDEIIGVFGAPKSYGSDAFDAVRAACRMRERLAELNVSRAARGEPPLAMGIGIHTGEVVAGCMGSEELLNYTCIGETVNLSSRLCSNAKAGQVLVSAATREEAGPAVTANALTPLAVKGFAEPVPVFEIAGVDEAGGSRQ